MSALPSEADIRVRLQHVCFVQQTRSLQRLGSCSASSVDVGGSIPSPPTTAGPRHARVSNIWSPAGRSTTCICSDSPHHWGRHICPRNLRLDPHIAPRLSLLLPVSRGALRDTYEDDREEKVPCHVPTS